MLETNEQTLTKCLDIISDLSFLQQNSEKVQASSQLVDFVQNQMDEYSLEIYMKAICDFYREFLEKFYKVNSAILEESQPESLQK